MKDSVRICRIKGNYFEILCWENTANTWTRRWRIWWWLHK